MNFFNIFYQFFPLHKHFVYVAMGDSTVEGIGATAPHRSYTGLLYSSIKEKKKKSSYHNLGVKGATVSDVINGQLQKALALKPDLITLSIGANDIRTRTNKKKFEKDLTFLLTELHNRTNAEILVNTIPDLSLTPAIPRFLKSYSKYMAKRFNTVIVNVGEELSIPIVDLYNYSRSIIRQFPEAIAGDGFHPSDFGYAIWANTMIPHLHKTLR